MKHNILILTAFVAWLTGCSSASNLNTEDRAFLVETKHATEQARDEAVQAAETASVASEKASRIYERSQNK